MDYSGVKNESNKLKTNSIAEVETVSDKKGKTAKVDLDKVEIC